MKFEVASQHQAEKRKVIYSNQEQCFDMDRSLHTDFTLMLGCAYVGLDVSLSSMEVVNISGFCPTDTWIKKTLHAPIPTRLGTIKIVSRLDLCNGTGTYLFDDADVYFDENSGWCYIDGKMKLSPEQNVQFCENVLFSLCGNFLVGIWIHLTKGNIPKIPSRRHITN